MKNEISSFYRDKYNASGIDLLDIKTQDDFACLPFLSREELAKIDDPLGRLFFDEKDTDIVSFTSGTSSSEPLILFKNFARHETNPLSLGKLETKNPKRVLLMLKPHQIPLNYIARREQKMLVVVGDINKQNESALLASKLKINIIQTTPTFLMYFAKSLGQFYDLKNIELIYLSGEALTKTQYELLKTLFPGGKIICRYSTQEAGNIGYKCSRLIENADNLNTYHVRSNNIFAEIYGAEKADKLGELVITTLEKSPTPLIRYRTGDLIEFSERKCGCGAFDTVFKILGRIKNGKVSLNGVEFWPESFEPAIKNVLSFVEDSFGVHFYQTTVGNSIVGKIEVELLPKTGVRIDKIAIKVMEEIFNRDVRVSNRFSFKDLIKQGLFFPIKINLIEPLVVHDKTPVSKKLIPHFY